MDDIKALKRELEIARNWFEHVSLNRDHYSEDAYWSADGNVCFYEEQLAKAENRAADLEF